MTTRRKPRPDYSFAGANRDRPGQLPAEGPALRQALLKAGVASAADVVAVEEEVTIIDGDYQSITEKGQPDGYAELDGTGKVPAAQLPAAGDGVYAAGSFTLGTGTFRVMADHLELTGTQEATLEGDAILAVL